MFQQVVHAFVDIYVIQRDKGFWICKMSAHIPGRSYILNATLMFHNLIYAMLVALQLFVLF